MTTEKRETAVDDVGFWTFVDYAMTSPRNSERGIDTEAARLFITLRRSTELMFYDLRAPVRDAGLSEAGFSLLYILDVTGEITMKKLVELSGMSKASVSAVVRTLAADGLVERTKSVADGRSITLCLSEIGAETVARIYPRYNEREQSWAELLSEDDRAHLVRILASLMDGGREALRRA
ncbi:MarR family winged helix-turn-helix transcriptional regulator [Leifsonia poae]|uniref:MarR family winged helix-turn-helix transcriptional regulator n=1 Tax=Leifsonia poae TaxID=110933 RepID=UPI001CC17CE9|nr:MarR family transcriptional regulator [Leifsonia poae]